MIPEGIISPVITPLTTDQDPDIPAFRILLDKLINGGVHGLFVAGTAGLGTVLTDARYELLVGEAAAHVHGRIPVLAGVLEPSTARCKERLRILQKAGITAAVLVAPYYLRAQNDEQLLRHFGILRESTDLELAVYNIPGCTGTDLPLPVIEEMARKGWITACKDSSGDAEYFTALCRLGRENGIGVYQGLRPDFAEFARLGAAGCVPVPGNLFPEMLVKAWSMRHEPGALAPVQEQCDCAWNELVHGTDFFTRSVKRLAEQGIGTGTLPEPF